MTLTSRAVALALVVVAVAASTTDAAARRRNQKFWKMNRQNRDRNGDDFFRSSDGDLVYVGKGAAGKGQQVNMGFKFPTRPTTYQGGGGQISEESPGGGEEQVPGKPNCMKKLVLVNEIVYEEKIKCHHSYRKNCFDTFVTTYEPEEEASCSHEYQKNCFIEYNKVAKEYDVERCHQGMQRDCDLPGETVCTIEAEVVCETLYKEYDAVEDHPECETVEKAECDTSSDPDDPDCSVVIPRQVCKLGQKVVRKTKPNTECRREETRVCGPSSCPLAPGERICENVAKAVLEDVPNEICDLVPQRVCNQVTKLVPKLVPKRKCVDEPNEVCIRMRVNPKQVRRPVIKEWCTDGESSPAAAGSPERY